MWLNLLVCTQPKQGMVARQHLLEESRNMCLNDNEPATSFELYQLMVDQALGADAREAFMPGDIARKIACFVSAGIFRVPDMEYDEIVSFSSSVIRYVLTQDAAQRALITQNEQMRRIIDEYVRTDKSVCAAL